MEGRYREVLRDPELLAAREGHFDRLRRVYAGEPADPPLMLWGYHGRGRSDLYAHPERWVEETLDDLAREADRLRDRTVFRPLVVEGPFFGVHFVDRILGAEVYELEPGNWQAKTLNAPVGELQAPNLDSDPTWDLARRAARAFLDAEVTVPLFGLPTLSSALNTALNLYGQELLVAMYTQPDAVHRDLRVINDVLCDLHRWYLAHVPLAQLQPVLGGARTQPPGYGQLCGCSTHLLPADLYREFVAPLDDALLRVYPHGGMIHLCGDHLQHLPVWREMDSVRALQMNDRAAEDFETYYRESRPDQVIYPIPCEEMPLARILDISGGWRTVVWADVPPWGPRAETTKQEEGAWALPA